MRVLLDVSLPYRADLSESGFSGLEDFQDLCSINF